MTEKIRRPVVAGQFYDNSSEGLKKSIERCFIEDRGPGELPKIKNESKRIHGFVVPHAGYFFSGAIAAHCYQKLSYNGFAKSFIILGPNHTGMGSRVAVMTEGKWNTPLGDVPINKTIAQKIYKDIIDEDETPHYSEHSIEVQLPFLQFISESNYFDFVPICMKSQDYNTSKEVGEIIASAIKKSKEKIVIIASTDFTHAGFNYQNMPPEGMRVDEYANKQDKLAIEKIMNMDPKGLINTVYENNITMCGYGAVAAMLVAIKILGGKKPELLKYGTSYEVHPSTSCVGYCSLAIY
jgi:AmmeMemoRadiSam system protein B